MREGHGVAFVYIYEGGEIYSGRPTGPGTPRRAWSTVFGSGPKRFSLMLDLGADAGVMVDCMTWVASEILAPLTSLGSTCRAKQAGCSRKQFARSRGRGNVRGLTEDAG